MSATTGPEATTRDEERVFVPCGEEHLSAIVTRPTTAPKGVAVIFYAGRWSVTSIGRSRLFVYLARRLAGFGYHSLRLDYLGLGESTGIERPWDLAHPFREEPDAAVRWLAGRQLENVLVMGTCGGARLALDSTRRIEGVLGAVLFSPPVRDYSKGDRTASLPASEFVRRALRKRVLLGIRDPQVRRRYLYHVRWKAERLVRGARRSARDGAQADFEWVSPQFLDPLEELVRRRIPVLLFFGRDDAAYEELERGRSGRLGRILERAGDLVQLVVVDGRFHGLAQADVGPLALQAIEAWLPSTEQATERLARLTPTFPSDRPRQEEDE